MTTTNLRNTSGEPLNLGTAGGRRVEIDEVIHVEGDLIEETEEAYVIGVKPRKLPDDSSDEQRAEHDAALSTHRAFPRSTWTNAGGPKNATPDVPKPATEEKV